MTKKNTNTSKDEKCSDISEKKIENGWNCIANRREQKTIQDTHKEKNQSREISRSDRTNGRRREGPLRTEQRGQSSNQASPGLYSQHMCLILG